MHPGISVSVICTFDWTLDQDLAFYAAKVDEAWVGDERAEPQPGGFYGGWVTSAIVGPIKGAPGSAGW